MLPLLSAPIDEIKLTIKNIKQNKTKGIVINDIFLRLILSSILFKKGSNTKNDDNAPIWLKMDDVHIVIFVSFNIGSKWRKLVYLIERTPIKTAKADAIETLTIDVIKTLLKPFLDIKSVVPIKNINEYQIGVPINIFVWIALELTEAHSMQINISPIEKISKNKFPRGFPRAL